MTSQIMRAALSVANNIAEGSARTTKPDQSRFYTIAFGSLIEVVSDLIIAYELEYIKEKEYIMLRENIEKIGNKINALKKAINKKD